MNTAPWMLYGASGFTGRMIAAEAARRGLHPILAGRSAERLRPLAESLHLPWRVVDLTATSDLENALRDVQAVLLTAGPFVQTAPNVLRACLATGTAYADISNDIPHLLQVQQLAQAAREQGIAIVPGVGFGVVVSNCLVRYVVEQLPDATELRCATHIAAASGSAGAAETGLEVIQGGGRVYRDGRYVPYRLGRGATRIRFADTSRLASPTPLGDLAAAVMATTVPNITLYSTALPTGLAGAGLPLVRRALGIPAVRAALLRPTAPANAEHPAAAYHSQAWAWGRNDAGQERQVWLTLGDGYDFTASASVSAMEHILQDKLAGVLTPAMAFGADFVLAVPGTQRLTTLPDD